MNRPLNSIWPYVGLLLTWMCALMAQRLIPGSSPTASTVVFWVGMPSLYVCALAYGYLRRNKHTWTSELLRGAVLTVGALGAVLVNSGAPDEPVVPLMLFYVGCMVQVSLGVTLAKERSLYSSLAISCLLLGFSASRPRSDTPLLLMLLPFIACFVFTLVSHQLRVATTRAGAQGHQGGWLRRIVAGTAVVLMTILLGITLLFLTPTGDMGPMTWKLDRDFILELAGGGQQSVGEAQLSGPANSSGNQGASEGTFAKVLKRELGKADTVGGALDAVGKALQEAAKDAAKKVAQSLSAQLKANWWWYLMLLLLLPLLLKRVRLWLRVKADVFYLTFRRARPMSRQEAVRVAAAMERLLQLRGYPRPLNQTWTAHLLQIPVAAEGGRTPLLQFASAYEADLYGRTEGARLRAQDLPNLYVAIIERTRFPRVRLTWRQQFAVRRTETPAAKVPQRYTLLRHLLSLPPGRSNERTANGAFPFPVHPSTRSCATARGADGHPGNPPSPSALATRGICAPCALLQGTSMLNATSTRDLNQAARSAEKFLHELGFELPHAKALDLVARLVGKPHHMAAQATLPKKPAAAPAAPDHAAPDSAVGALPKAVVDAVRQVVFGCGATADENGQVLVSRADVHALYLVTNQAVESATARAGVRPTAMATEHEVIENLCKVLTNRDVEAALYELGISDAANAALALASPYVRDAVLAEFSLDSLQQAYDDLPVSVDAEEFSEGHGNWSLSEAEFRQAKRLADALYAGKRQRAEELSSTDQRRICAQFELLTGQPAQTLRLYLQTKSNLHDEVVRHVLRAYGKQLNIGPWLLASDKMGGYWCEPTGWTPSREAASGFDNGSQHSGSLTELTQTHAADIRWVRYEDAADYPITANVALTK